MASTSGRRVIEALTNQSGGAVIAGDVVVIDSANDSSFTTNTAGGFIGTVGVAQESIASLAIGRVCTAGQVDLVNVNAAVTRGNFGKTHTVAKQATDAGASRAAGAFCQFLTGGTTPKAHLFGIADASSSSSGVPSGTSFPGTPATNDLYFRTDRGLLYFYDGTRWLTTTLYHLPFSGSDRALATITATTNNYASATMWAGDDVYLVDYIWQVNIATTNDATNYWDWLLQKLETTATVGTTIVTPTSAALATGWTNSRTAINAAHTDIGSIRTNVNKTGTPGAFLGFFAVSYRLIG